MDKRGWLKEDGRMQPPNLRTSRSVVSLPHTFVQGFHQLESGADGGPVGKCALAPGEASGASKLMQTRIDRKP
jgi:hypothetical protein